jgi:hypothetical protein
MSGDQQLYRRALANAVHVAGGEEAVREYLDVPQATLQTWLLGAKPIPEAVFLKVIDLLLDPPPHQRGASARQPKS